MQRWMRERRLHAAGGGLPAPTKAWLQSRVPLPMNGKAVLMPWRRLLRHRRQLLLVAAIARMQFPNHRWDSEKAYAPGSWITACATTGVAIAAERNEAMPRNVNLVIEGLHPV